MVVAPLAASASISAASTGHRDAARSAWRTSRGVASAGRPRQISSRPRSCWARACCSPPQVSSAASANKASARSATPAAAAAWPAVIRRRPAVSGSGERRAARSSAPEPVA